MTSQNKTILTLLEMKENRLKEEVKNHRNKMLKKQIRLRLEEISEAKKRLEEEAYGFCEVCFKTIPWRELCREPERRCCEACASSAKAQAG